MCIYLFYQYRKRRRTRIARAAQTQPNQPTQTKQNTPCEHQLAGAAAKANDGVLDTANSGLEVREVGVGPCGPKHCPECRAEKKRATIYRWKVTIALVVPNIMAAMDMTIIATALPTIASHFCKSVTQYNQVRSLLIAPTAALAQLNWIVTAFTLASTSSIPLYGQIADVFGRHSVLQASIFFILIGSALAAGAQAWAMFLLGRALQGLGFAGLQTVTRVILSDKVSLKDTSTNNTLFTLFVGLGFGTGPVVGGYLTKVCLFIAIFVTLADFPGELAMVFHYQRAHCRP